MRVSKLGVGFFVAIIGWACGGMDDPQDPVTSIEFPVTQRVLATGGFCGGIAGFPCPSGFVCLDDPRDACDPSSGGADCGGLCVTLATGKADKDRNSDGEVCLKILTTRALVSGELVVVIDNEADGTCPRGFHRVLLPS